VAKNDVSIIVTLRDQASKEFGKIGASADAAKSKISSIRGELAGIAAGAGIAGFGMYMAKQAIEWGNAVDDISDVTGAAGEEASKLLVIGKSVGVGIEENVTSFAKFGKAVSLAKDAMAAANAKGQESNDMFSRLGLTLDDVDGKDLYEVFRKVVSVMREMEDGADKDRVAMELFGKSGYKMHDMLNLTDEQMQKTIDKAQKMGLIFSSETAAGAEKLDRQIKALTGTTSKLAIAIGSDLMPAIQEKVTWLQEATDKYTALDAEQRQSIARVIEIASEIGAMILVVKGLTTAFRLLSLANPWYAIATAIGAATIAMIEYNNVDRGTVKSYDVRDGAGGWKTEYQVRDPNVLGGWRKATQQEVQDYNNKKNYDSSTVDGLLAESKRLAAEEAAKNRVTLRAEAPTGGSSGSDKLEHDIERAKEKIADMIADLSGKIVAETGTTLEANIAKVKADVEKMQYDINEAAGKGVDVEDAQKKLDAYSNVMREKYVKSWREAWQDLKGQMAQTTAELLDDKNAEADAELAITRTRLDREREDKLKTVQQDKNDAEAKLAVEQWYSDQLALAERKTAQQKRQNTMDEYSQQVEHNNNLLVLAGKNQIAVDNLNREVLNKSIAYMREQLANAKLTADERLKIEKNLADAQRQMWEINGRDLKTAYAEAARQINETTYNYADRIVETWDDISNSISGHLSDMMTGVESWGDGFLSVISEVSKSISKMFADILIQQYVMQPAKSWFTSLLSGVGSGTGSSAYVESYTAGKANVKYFASGGYNSGGWTVVGEEGPELVNFSNPGRVYNASDTRNMMNQRGSAPVINMNITTPDANSFRQSRTQIMAGLHAGLAQGRRNL